MGYRHYMYKISKKTVKQIENKDYDYLSKKYNYEWNYGTEEFDLDIFRLPMERIYEFGKLYYDDTAERIYKYGKPMFQKKVMEKVEDYNPYVIPKEALLEAITIYTEKVRKYYNGLLEDGETLVGFLGIETQKETSKEEKWKRHIEQQIQEWSGQFGPPYNLKEETDYIVSSWKYEYALFELVRLYKTIDFNKYDLVFLGY